MPRAFLIAGVIAGTLLPPASAAAQTVRPATEQADWRPLAIGLGAVAGVVAFNVLVLGVDALPGGFAYGPGATVPAEMSVAMSRVYATTAAAAGGLIARYGFGR